MTRYPLAMRWSQRCEPRNPAPPVTTAVGIGGMLPAASAKGRRLYEALTPHNCHRTSRADARSAYGSPVETRRHKHLVLIRAREFASNLATPTLIADDQGKLVFYNEAAEPVVGRPFAEVGEMSLDEWSARFEPRTLDSEPLSPERRPTRIALDQRRAVHED